MMAVGATPHATSSETVATTRPINAVWWWAQATDLAQVYYGHGYFDTDLIYSFGVNDLIAFHGDLDN